MEGKVTGTHKEGLGLVEDSYHTHPHLIQASRAEHVRVEPTLLHQGVLLLSACQG